FSCLAPAGRTQAVDRPAMGEVEEVGAERPAFGVVALGPVPEENEGVMRDLPGGTLVLQDLVRDREDRPGVAPERFRESVLVPAPDPEHEERVACFGEIR